MVNDHRGDTFVSELEMCNSWGIDYRLFRERRRRGGTSGSHCLRPSMRERQCSTISETHLNRKPKCARRTGLAIILILHA